LISAAALRLREAAATCGSHVKAELDDVAAAP
jgi:hypothetical protein